MSKLSGVVWYEIRDYLLQQESVEGIMLSNIWNMGIILAQNVLLEKRCEDKERREGKGRRGGF